MIIRNKNSDYLWRFFAFTFLFSWLLWLPNVLITHGLIPENKTAETIAEIGNWLAGIGPSLAAIWIILKYQGKSKFKELINRIFALRLGSWYWPLFLLLPIVLVLAHCLNSWFFNAPFPESGLLNEPWWIPLLLLIFFILQFGEELGWRGFALDRLLARMNVLQASVVVGSIWAVWHLPMFISKGFGQYEYHMPFLQFFLTLVLISVIITWMQINTGGSLFPAFLIHAQINLSGEVLPLIEKNKDSQGDYTAWIILNILLIIVVLYIIKFRGIQRPGKR